MWGVQVHKVVTVACLNIKVVEVLEVKDQHVAHLEQDWDTDTEEDDCPHRWGTVKVTALELWGDALNREEANLRWEENLQEEKHVNTEEDPLEEVATWEDDYNPTTTHLLIIPYTYSCQSIEQNTEK